MMSGTPKHSVSVAGVVVDDADRVLVIRRDDNGAWQAPGGVLELDESFQEGVAREVFEETGLKVSVEHLTGVYKNISLGVVALVFRCVPIGGDIRCTAEAREVCWMTTAQVKAVMTPAFAVRVLDAFADQIHTRTHDGTNLL